MTVVAVSVGRARSLPGRRSPSAIVKEPVPGEVAVAREGLAGDEQADRESHGGPDKAVLAYGAARYPAWGEGFGLLAGPGGFGENLTIAGLDEETACIGDTVQAGTALLQVTQPRLPCWKLAARWSRPDLVGLVEETGWSGWYLRVLEPGVVAAGSPVTLVARPHPAWTVREAFRVGRLRGDPSLGELTALPELSAAWRERLLTRLDVTR